MLSARVQLHLRHHQSVCSQRATHPVRRLAHSRLRFGNNHDPIEDLDRDRFSTVNEFRGADWRGKDCNDADNAVYAGRLPNPSWDAVEDSNCNGIYGADPKTNKPYEQLYCDGTNAMGTILLGDSAGAHFHIPPEWLTASLINSTTYSNLISVLENEFDWPMYSASTGHLPFDFLNIPNDSLYLRMRANNLCNHRDYQNLGVNGARVGSMNDTIIREIGRMQQVDKPALVWMALIGNDVCNGHPDPSHMTTPTEFRASVLASLAFLDTKLPKGSHVLLSGLANGLILYDSLHNRTHPVGQLHNDVLYSDLYDFMNCLEVSGLFPGVVASSHAPPFRSADQPLPWLDEHKRHLAQHHTNPRRRAQRRPRRCGGQQQLCEL
jgi:acyloxyacyl hydrolase